MPSTKKTLQKAQRTQRRAEKTVNKSWSQLIKENNPKGRKW